MLKYIILFVLLISCKINFSIAKNLSLNINGLIKSANGLGQITINLLNIYNLLLDDLSFLDSRKNVSTFYDLPENIEKIFCNKIKDFGVSIFTDQLTVYGEKLYLNMPANSIKYAYSMVESSLIPKNWVNCLNKDFDAVIVPDNYLISVYKKSGVEIPIFCLPLPIIGLQKCLDKPIKKLKPINEKFIFGVSAALSRNKNIELLIKAFAIEFGNNSDVVLEIHSYWDYYSEEIRSLITELSLKNVILTTGEINFDEYLFKMANWDCLVLISKGEGYSITPRLAMGLGIPTILSNNTAHKTLNNSGYPLSVDSNILKKSDSEFYSEDIGYNFDCDINDVSRSLREMYNNYEFYLKKAHLSREWVKKYLPENLKYYYLQLIKPNSIKLSNKDIIYNNKILTTSKILFSKYLKINTKNHKNSK